AHRIYAPWKIVPWSIAYGTAYRKAFDAAQLTAFGVVMFPMLIGIGIMRRRRRAVRAFGTASWGTIEDAAKAGLVDPKQRATGRVLGKIDGKRLTFHGPAHSIVVAPARSGKG